MARGDCLVWFDRGRKPVGGWDGEGVGSARGSEYVCTNNIHEL